MNNLIINMTGFKSFVYFILDPTLCNVRDVATILAAALRGGAGLIQYRDKSQDRERIRKISIELLSICKNSNVPLLINDHVDIAHEIGADGVHIGQGDMDPAKARAILGRDKIIGLTAYTQDHIRAVDPQVVDYIGTGPVYPTQTDKGKPVLGVETFADLVRLSPVPVYGIGGITAENASAVIQAGAAGVAVMRAISQADDPELATRALVKVIQSG
jgi:thiamine-phosphate pyrophosphorylase